MGSEGGRGLRALQQVWRRYWPELFPLTTSSKGTYKSGCIAEGKRAAHTPAAAGRISAAMQAIMASMEQRVAAFIADVLGTLFG